MSKPVAIVTGGASGIGLALVQHLLAKGYKVVIADVNEKNGTARQSELGSDVLFHRTDVSLYSDQLALFEHAFSWGGGRIDFFAANAGIDDRQNMYQDNEDLDDNGAISALNLKTMQVDLDAVFQGLWIFKHYVRKSPQRAGKAVITSSMGGLYASPVNPQYCVAKSGLIALARCVGPVYLEKERITVNTICPAFVVTNLCPPEVLRVFPKEHITPMSTILKAYDLFLGSDTLTGQVVEATLDELHFRKQVDFPNESQKWMITDSAKIWAEAYKVPLKKD